MSDLIRREDAKKAVEIVDFYKGTDIVPSGYASDAIDAIPAVDAVEVVRCRECVHLFTDVLCINGILDRVCYYCKAWDEIGDYYVPTREDYFCSRGKRREDGLYESLKRGLEEAIAYERGEVECRTERREEADT